MRNLIFATAAVLGLISASAAMADDFGGSQPQDQQSVNAYLDNQAANAQLSDPTAPNSIRSHGHP